MIGTPIAFGLTMIVCFTLFYYYWRIRQLRARLLSAQTTPVQVDLPVEFGIGQNVVETFPTIKACEIKSNASEDLQCPICLVDYEEWEVLRQLPFCGHIFHTLCVGAWFEKQTTCPVCRMSMSELTESFGDSLVAESIQIHCRRPAPPDATVEVFTESSAPSWMTLNGRLPQPAPPGPGTTPDGTLSTCTCPGSGAFLIEAEITQPKTATDSDVAQVDQTCLQHADFHVVNIPQVEWTHTSLGSNCNVATTRIQTVTSKNPEIHHQSDAQILIFQASITTAGKTNEIESVTTHLSSQATSDSGDPSLTSAEITVQEDEQMAGSFEFQPVLASDDGLTFKAVTL